MRFDIIIFHTTFLSSRWNPNAFHRNAEKVSSLKNSNAIKIAFPQDEFFNTDVLCNFIKEFNISHVFSVAPTSECEKIYRNVYFGQVKFHQVLTGYLEKETIKKIQRYEKNNYYRNIDIGYRAYRAPQWLGRHGFLKTKIAELFKENSSKYNLKVDISTDNKRSILGNKWYKFLLNCKYTIGVEGGASILDRDGSIKDRTEKYLFRYPNASFEEIERNCFPNKDYYLNLFTISPRHLEACVTKTCQILVKGKYNDILKPNVHYIELEPDFSNLHIILREVKQDKLRAKIINNSYNDIVNSDLYTYKVFVNFVLKKVQNNNTVILGYLSIKDILLHSISKYFDILSWHILAIKIFFSPFKKKIIRLLKNNFSRIRFCI